MSDLFEYFIYFYVFLYYLTPIRPNWGQLMQIKAELNLSVMFLFYLLSSSQAWSKPPSWLFSKSPVMSSRWGTAPWCWTARWRGRDRSPSPGDGMASLWRQASGRRCSVTVRCSSETSLRDERVTRRTQENTTAPHRTATACWSAARPGFCSHVSHMTTSTAKTNIQLKHTQTHSSVYLSVSPSPPQPSLSSCLTQSLWRWVKGAWPDSPVR